MFDYFGLKWGWNQSRFMALEPEVRSYRVYSEVYEFS